MTSTANTARAHWNLGRSLFGAYEFAHTLEGGVSYLVLAAPLIAISAAFIPPIAEATWRARGKLKAILWWVALIPTGAVVFFSVAERVHVAKAGAQIERSALRSVAVRAKASLTKAEAELATPKTDATVVPFNAASAKRSGFPIGSPERRPRVTA
jgi:hypothetical protein